MPAAATRLVVAPSLLADTGRRLTALTESTSARLGAHAAGPRPSPVLGDASCTVAYANGQHQLAGLVTVAVAQSRALAHGLGAAAALYSALDTGAGGSADVVGESLAELGPVTTIASMQAGA
jgi:hypothetical protein